MVDGRGKKGVANELRALDWREVVNKRDGMVGEPALRATLPQLLVCLPSARLKKSVCQRGLAM